MTPEQRPQEWKSLAHSSTRQQLLTYLFEAAELCGRQLEQLKLADTWVEADEEFEHMMPDDWTTTKKAYRAREAYRDARGKG